MADVVNTLATAIMANQRVPDLGAARRTQTATDRRRMVMFRARRKADREAAVRRPKGG